MSAVESFHREYGAVFVDRGGRRYPDHFGRPETAHKAVRNGVGVIEMPAGIVAVTGDDRVEFVDNVVSCRVPSTEGVGRYGLLCDPQGRIEFDLYVFNAGERILVLTPAGHGSSLATEWRGKIFIQDVEVDELTDELTVFGVHGPTSTEKVASVFSAGAPEGKLTFERGQLGEVGVTVVVGDDPTGEESYLVICSAGDAESVIDTLLTRGLNAVPFGLQTWASLTLEAGTPLFESELEGNIPNMVGLGYAVDYDKGCFIGQEVISRIHNRGRVTERLVGIRCEAVPSPGAAVFDGDRAIGEVTRAVLSPTLETAIAFAQLRESDVTELAVRIDGEDHLGTLSTLPFVEGSGLSARIPTY